MSQTLAIPTLAAQRRQILRNDQLVVRSNLNGQQSGTELGNAIPIVFGRRVNDAGGVLISPPAVLCRFVNDTANQVTASYELVISDGQIGTIAAGDVYQGDTPLVSGEFTQDHGSRAGSWTPANLIQQRFEVTVSTDVKTVEGKLIGNDSAGALDLGGLSTTEINQLIDNSRASVEISSRGNYVTSFEVSVVKTIDWFENGVQVATRGAVYLAIGQAEPGAPSGFSTPVDVSTLPWSVVTDAVSLYDGATSTSGPSVRAYGYAAELFTVGNRWIYDRGNAARYLPTAQYTVTRPASTEPYGDIDLTITEVISPGYVLTETAPGVSLFGGLPPAIYTVTTTEINSAPLPKPEATLYCGTDTGTFAGLSTLSVVKEYPAGDDGWQRQVHAFIRNGISVPRFIEGTSGPSNQLPDLVQRLMVASAKVPSALIDTDSLLLSARFCATYGFTFDGVVANPTNIREWVDRHAPLFLLKPSNRWGKIGLRPALPVTTGNALDAGVISPRATFDEASMLPGSFSYTYTQRSERLPFAALVLWREQPTDDVGTTRSTELRYAGTAIDGPYEEIDCSEFATREAHAIKAGAYQLAMRRHVTHRGSFQVAPTAAVSALAPGDIIRVTRARTPTIGSATVWSYLYEIESISGPPLGPWTISITHFPVDLDGRSVVVRDVLAAAAA